MSSRRVEFDITSLKDLLTHYSEGVIPLTAEVKAVQSSQFLPRWVCLILESEEWENTPFEKAGYGGQEPYLFRYEGKRTMNLNDLKDPIEWSEPGEIEAPRRQ